MRLDIGTKVLVTDLAFSDSTEPREIAIRGKMGIITFCYGGDPSIHDQCYEVEIDGDEWPLCDEEIKPI